MTKLIMSISHYAPAEVVYWYEWYKKLSDVKIILQSDVDMKHKDVHIVDIPGTMVVPQKMRLYCHYALKYNYDYYVFLDSDAFILCKEFLDKIIEYMYDKKAHVCFTELSDKLEHYKGIYYDFIRKHYKTDLIVHSLNILTVCSRQAIELYNRINYFKIYDEVDFPTVMVNNIQYCVYTDFNYHLFNADVIDYGKAEQIKKEDCIIHALKDYDILRRRGIKLQ